MGGEVQATTAILRRRRRIKRRIKRRPVEIRAQKCDVTPSSRSPTLLLAMRT
jgi:hypothetical protein